MGIGLLAISTLNASIVDQNCNRYAAASVRAEFRAFGFSSQEEVDEAFDWYKQVCEEANTNGETLLEPAFVSN